MEIRESKTLEYVEVKKFYKNIGHEWSINPYDYFLIAKEKDKIIGSVKINEEHGYPILSGLYVEQNHRGQGVATKMLRKIEQHMQGQESYCFPSVYLKGFYKIFGYEPLEFDKAPDFLKKQLLFNNKPRRFFNQKQLRIIMRK